MPPLPDGWRFRICTGAATSDAAKKARGGTKAGKGQDFICSLMQTPIQRSYIQAEGKAGRLKYRLMSIVAESSKGRIYLKIHTTIANTPLSCQYRSTLHPRTQSSNP